MSADDALLTCDIHAHVGSAGWSWGSVRHEHAVRAGWQVLARDDDALATDSRCVAYQERTGSHKPSDTLKKKKGGVASGSIESWEA